MGIGDILFVGSVSLLAGATVAKRHRRVGDGLAYFGLACWLGGPLWWLFYQ